MVWIKRVGKGRVFNSVLGHRPEFYMMPDLVQMLLGGIQFVLGDLEADATPSAKVAAGRAAIAADDVNTEIGVVARTGAQPSGVRMQSDPRVRGRR